MDKHAFDIDAAFVRIGVDVRVHRVTICCIVNGGGASAVTAGGGNVLAA